MRRIAGGRAAEHVRRLAFAGHAAARLVGEGDDAVSPALFLPHAERSELILAVDRWVVAHAVPLLARCQAVQPDFELAVNLSGRSIGDAVLERLILDRLDRHGVDPSGLVLEVTETAAVSDLAGRNPWTAPSEPPR